MLGKLNNENCFKSILRRLRVGFKTFCSLNWLCGRSLCVTFPKVVLFKGVYPHLNTTHLSVSICQSRIYSFQCTHVNRLHLQSIASSRIKLQYTDLLYMILVLQWTMSLVSSIVFNSAILKPSDVFVGFFFG